MNPLAQLPAVHRLPSPSIASFHGSHHVLPGFVDPILNKEIVKTESLSKQISDFSVHDFFNHGLFPPRTPDTASLYYGTDRASNAIKAAQADANTHGISGKAVTPYLLQRIFELTEGRSLTANIALVRNNARFASKIAAALMSKDA